MRKELLLLCALFLSMAGLSAQTLTRLYVGESTYLSPPSPPFGFKLYQTKWGCDEANISLSSLGDKVKITVTGYFTSKGRVQCDYTIYNAEKKLFDYRTEYYFVECRKTSISLDKENLELKEGSTYSLIESFSPSSAPQPKVTWSSSNREVAEVSQYGTVTAKKAGVATITAKTNAGTEAECKVTVKAKNLPATKITAKDKLTIKIGATQKLIWELVPADATSKVTFTSDKKDVVSVNDAGTITAHKVGKAVITIKTDNGLTVKTQVTVEALSEQEVKEMNRKILGKASEEMSDFSSDYSYQYLLWIQAKENQ